MIHICVPLLTSNFELIVIKIGIFKSFGFTENLPKGYTGYFVKNDSKRFFNFHTFI